MLGIVAEVIQHRLNVNLERKPVQQRQWIFTPKCNKAIMDEVDKLLVVGFIWEVYYLDWLANVVLVKKPMGSDVRGLHQPEKWLP